MDFDRSHKLSNQDYTSLVKLRRALDLIIAENRKMPILYARTFVEVSLNPLRGPTAYAQSIGVSQPYMSRVLREIGADPRHRAEIVGLIDSAQSPTSGREMEYFLTPNGLMLMQRLIQVLK